MDLFAQDSDNNTTVQYKYPDIPEYSAKELLLLEKESSGMYFSGHIIDSYSKHIESISPDKISDIIESAAEDELGNSGKYKDKSQVKIAGIITAKRTKITKNGATMAFLTLEDRYGDIDVIVFAKSYDKYYQILGDENALIISGNLSFEEGEAPRVLLSDAEVLIEDTEYNSNAKSSQDLRLFIKVTDLNDKRINNLKRISSLNRGNAKVILYDESTKKYCALKDALIDPSEKVLTRLCSLFGNENVILK
jgi:DNA polymerase-3 subunit alpha